MPPTCARSPRTTTATSRTQKNKAGTASKGKAAKSKGSKDNAQTEATKENQDGNENKCGKGKRKAQDDEAGGAKGTTAAGKDKGKAKGNTAGKEDAEAASELSVCSAPARKRTRTVAELATPEGRHAGVDDRDTPPSAKVARECYGMSRLPTDAQLKVPDVTKKS